MSRALAIGLAVVAACGSERGAPRVRELPKPDGTPTLRNGGPPRSPRIANYKLDAHFDATKHALAVTETLTWTNPGATAVDTLPFHLYLNAFKNENTELMKTSRGQLRTAAFADGKWGYLQIDQVTIGGAPTTALHAVGPDETVAELPLGRTVEPGASIEIGFKYTAQLPEVFARSGYKDKFHLVGQWFPKIGVRVGTPGAETWACPPYSANTEFFADFGSYDVTLTVPNTYVVAATGVLVNAAESADNTRTFTYRADDVHDFAWMADPYMEVMSRAAKVEGGTVEVRVYYRPEQKHYAGRHLEAAVGTIEKMSAWFEPYPWPVMSVIDPPVDAAAGAGGMEYPMFVTTAGDSVFARRGIRVPELVTVHEIGHNWFQGMLASNEFEEAWLDEGVNEWADARVMAELYGAKSSGVDWLGWQAEIAALRTAATDDPDGMPSPIATAAYAFVDTRAYAQQTYLQTMRALRTLEQHVGASRFAAAMKAYVHAFAFKHPTGRDLVATLEAQLGTDLAWFFGPVLHGLGTVELAVRSAECRAAHPPRGWFGSGSARKLVTATDAPASGGYTCEVVVASTGSIRVPVDVELHFADGTTQQRRWDDRGAPGAPAWVRYADLASSTPLVEVVLDPKGDIALGSAVTRRYRVIGDGAAPLRAASWFGSFAQTWMQVIGP